MDIISAREAFDRGLTRYFTGKICCHGHTCERLISNGCCVECLNERRKRTRKDIYEATKVWRLKNPEARTIEAQKYRKKHPDKVSERAKRYREKNIEAIRRRDRINASRIRKSNPEAQKIRIARYKEKHRAKQERIAGRAKPEICEVCSEFNRHIVFDHCHISGEFRGWLCDRCNKTLGILKDDIQLLRALADYLENKGSMDGTKADRVLHGKAKKK